MSTRGFTLIELSIVLVIVGLLIGGALTGASLVRTSQLRSVLTEIEQFDTAVRTFTLKYNCIPGDCPHATRFWGEAPDCEYSGSCTLDGTTCNGGGDGVTDTYLNWQHLGLSELIPGKFAGCPEFQGQLVTNVVPRGRFPNLSYDWYPTDYNVPYAEYYFLADRAEGSLIFKPDDAFYVDTKLDDGKPLSGRVRNDMGVDLDSGCITSDDELSSVYDVAAKGGQFVCSRVLVRGGYQR